jgi:hypothetical protein
MESFVVQPEAAQILPLRDVGDSGGILPGRLPFIGLRRARKDAVSSYFRYSRRRGDEFHRFDARM